MEKEINEKLNPKIILNGEENAPELKPVHINTARTDDYFYHWSSEHKAWLRGEAIPETLKRAYINPVVKSNYK